MPFLTFCCFYCSEIIKGFSKGGCSDISKGKRPLEYNFVYTVPPPAAEPPKHEVVPVQPKDERSELDKLDDSVKALKIDRLKTLSGKAEFGEVYAAVSAAYPQDLEVLVARQNHLDSAELRMGNLSEIVAVGKEIVAQVDTSKLALHYGTNVNIEDPAENKARKEFDEQKTYLISAYSRMARAQLDLKDDAGFSGTLKELERWDVVTADTHCALRVAADAAKGLHGAVLEATKDKVRENSASADSAAYDATIVALQALGWEHALGQAKAWHFADRPTDYAKW